MPDGTSWRLHQHRQDRCPPKGSESVDKPGSVVDDHSSATNVTVRLKRPTRIRRGHGIGFLFGLAPSGLPSPRLLPTRGALLPHLFTLTCEQAASFLLHFRAHALVLPGALTRWSPTFLCRRATAIA